MVSDLPPDVAAAALRQDAPDPLPLENAAKALVPLADGIRITLADIALIPVHNATPEQRSQLVGLREELARVQRDVTTWLDAIDLSFRHAAEAMGAKEIPLANGVVKVEPPRGEWVVDVAGLRSELKEAQAHGLISAEEIDSIFKTKVEEKADGTRLNYFARNRGDELAEIIERHRRYVPGNPNAAKLRFIEKA